MAVAAQQRERTLGELVERVRSRGDVVLAFTLWLLVAYQAAAWLMYEEVSRSDLLYLILALPLFWIVVLPLTLRYGDDLRQRIEQIATAGLAANIGVFVAAAFIWERDALTVGVVSGSIFALGAVGLTLIYGVLKFGHFAHGDMMMLAAYIAFFFMFGFVIGGRPIDEPQILPFTVNDLPSADSSIWKFSFGYGLFLAMALSALVVAALFVALDRVVYKPLRQRRSGIVIFSIAALGLAIAVRSIILMSWGPTPRFYAPGIRERIDLPLDVSLLADQIFILGAAIAVTLVTYFVLYRTRLGKAMRAMADNPDLARVSGINTDRVIMTTWVLAGWLVAIAGVLLALQAQLDPELGFILLLPLFASAILGGIGSPQGAFVGGMIIGIVQEVGVGLDLEFIREGFPGPAYKFSIAFVVLITILLLRPRGLFGAKT